ncbi:MAG: ArsR/SmtB family transcription factor [Methanobrevibacter sp.]
MNHIEQLLWWIITAKRGGINRAKIIQKLHEKPYNANRLSKELDLDYKTIKHHINILEENKIIKGVGDNYGKLYFLEDYIEKNYNIFEKIYSSINIGKGGND